MGTAHGHNKRTGVREGVPNSTNHTPSHRLRRYAMCVSRRRALVSVRRAQGWWRAHISSKLSRSDAKEAASGGDAVASDSGATFERRPGAHAYGTLLNEDKRPWPM